MTANSTIIRVDADVADAYDTASEENQKKIQMLLRMWAQELSESPNLSLSKIMDRISDRAQARGLTSEILESILNES